MNVVEQSDSDAPDRFSGKLDGEIRWLARFAGAMLDPLLRTSARIWMGKKVSEVYPDLAVIRVSYERVDIRARPGAQVSTPFSWDELEAIIPDALTIATVPPRVSRNGDPWLAMSAAPQSLEPVLALHERDTAAGLVDAPWPPQYPKMPGEPSRVAPSRARKPDAPS